MTALAIPAGLAAACAALAAALFAYVLRHPEAPGERAGIALLFLAVGLYVGGAVTRIGDGQGLVLPSDLYGIAGAALTLAGLYVARFRQLPGLWSVVSAVAALFFAATALLAPTGEAVPGGGLLTVHIGFLLVAAGFLMLLGVAASLYMLKERTLRQNPAGWGRRLPSLETLDRYQLRALQVGFLLLTVGVSSGIVLILVTPDPAVDILAITTASVWALLGVLLYLRLWRDWRGHRLALASVTAVAVLVVTLVGTFGIGPFRHGGGA